MVGQYSVWLQCPVSNPEASWRLICFPHAGGAASFFREWGKHLPEGEVCGVRYPGRAERISEAPPTDLTALAGEVADAIEQIADRPLALFGHSMGAVIALEAAKSLEARGVIISQLFASGSRDGDCPDYDSRTLDDDPESVFQSLVRLRGMDPEVANDPQFKELVLPYVISDGRMFHAYKMPSAPLLRCPVTTVVGDVDADADCRPWSTLTVGGFGERVVAGGHFYLISDPPYALLRETLRPSANHFRTVR